MKHTTSLIDTNVIITFITQRDDPYKDECYEVIKLCSDNLFDGYIAFHSLSIIWYVIRKLKSDEEARFWLKNICEILTVTGASHEQVIQAINNSSFHDFEDCLQDECASFANVDYIVTCNTKDYTQAKNKVVTPDEFISIINKEGVL